MADQPAWTWRLRSDADERWWVRWAYTFLRWCTDSQSLANRLVSIVGLIFGAIYVTNHVFLRNTTTEVPLAVHAVAIVAILVALKTLVAHAAAVLFHDKKLVGGAPTEDRFERLVPKRAKKVALVGQNLASRLDEKYDLTLQGIQKLLSRRDSGKTPSVEEFWLVAQTPLALFSVHPAAARHLQSVTVNGLERLANDLADDGGRVQVAFHPAATLSMLVVDWHLDRRLAVVTPKMQTLPIIDRRACVVLSGGEFDTVAPHFDRFLSEARRREFPGARMVPLSQAANELRAMFTQDVVQCVRSYVDDEERRMAAVLQA